MDQREIARRGGIVKPTSRKPASGVRNQRRDLLAVCVQKHGLACVEVLLDLAEAEAGDLHLNRRLSRLIDLDPTSLAALVALIHGARR